MKDPLVSVLICSYNAEDFVEETMRSVINQTYSNMEILVLDNHSKDKTVHVLERLTTEDGRLRIYRGNKNLGAYGGLNCLLERATGKYIAIQDHDDLWCRDKIQKQIHFLEGNGDFAGSGTSIVNYYEKYGTYILRRQATISNVAWHTSLVFRNTGKRYDTSINIATDFHFMKEILCEGGARIYNFDEPCVLRRIRADNCNLSTKWVSFSNLGDVLHAGINTFDKLALLSRLILPQRVADWLIIRVLLKKSTISWKALEPIFGFAATPVSQTGD